MRWSRTPPAWQPSRSVFRVRERSYTGAFFLLLFGLPLLGLAAYGAQHEYQRLVAGRSFDKGAALVSVPAAIVGALLVWWAIDGVLRGYDQAFEIDPEKRLLLTLTGSRKIIPFEAIHHVRVHRTVTQFIEYGRLTNHYDLEVTVLIMPMELEMIAYKAGYKAGSVHAMAERKGGDMAIKVAQLLGVPMVDGARVVGPPRPVA